MIEAELEAQKKVVGATVRGLGGDWSTCTDVYVQVQLVGQLDGTLQDSGWSMVDVSVRSAVEALVLDGHLDPEETRPLAQQVFSEYVGSTVGNQMRYLARVAMESGVVQPQDLPADELTEDSWDLLEGSEEFQQMLELLVPVFTELTEQRLRAQTLNPVPEKTGGLRLSEGDLK